MSDSDLVEQLQRAVSGLLWMSESDYPFETLVWNIKPSSQTHRLTPQQVLQYSGHIPETPVETLEVDRFFAPVTRVQDWHDANQAAEVQRYQTLVALLRDSLTEVCVYRVGEVELDIYILGQTPAGNWLGLSTHAVET